MKESLAPGRPSVGRLRERLPIPAVAVMALGLILTGAGFSDAAARWWIGASGLLLVGLVGASILWRWRRESPVTVTSRQTAAIASLHARFTATPNAASPRPETGPPPDGPLAVAVVVPVYNGGAWLSDCLESVRRQTYDAWRCYVVDDASTDETAATASSFAARDSRFVVLRHGRNAGLSASRNTGLAHAEEPLVTFLDADDLLTTSSLRRREAVMRRRWRDATVAGAWGDVHTVGQAVTLADSETFDRDFPRKPAVHAGSHDGECPFNVHAPLLRTDLLRRLGGFDERLRRGAEDWDLWHRLLRHGYTLEHACGSAGLYRRHLQSMTNTDTAGHLDQSFQLLMASERRARVDERLVVDPHAAAPLARRLLAARWVRRVAIYHGMYLAAGGDRNTARLDESIGRVQGAPRVLLTELEKYVRGGLRRGLGIGSSARLPEPEATQVGEIAQAVAEEIRTAAAGPPREDEDDAPPVDCLPLQAEPDVVVVAETAADVRSLVDFVRRLRDSGWDAVALDADYARGDQGATQAWQRTDVPLVPCNHLRFGRVRAARMLVCRPFGPLTAGLAAATRGGGGVVVEWSAGVAEARLPCNDTESMFCDDHWTADMQVPKKETGVGLDPVAIRAVRAESPEDSVRTDAGSSPGPATHCLDVVREEGALDHESTALIESLRDRHRGETVVVIGNGPSLNDTDLGLLTGVATIGVNGIFYAQDRLPEPLTYYVVEDTSVFRENIAAIKAFECGCKLFPTLYRPAFRDDEIDRARVGFFRMNMGFYGRGTRTRCLPRFSTDAVQRLYCGQSVTIINLQLAWWMGFSRVVLIGMDFSYTIPPDADRRGDLIRSNSDDVNHFHPDYFGKGKTWKDPKLDRVLANYALAREMFAADGREIVNATVGGRLEAFPRMPLARALAEAVRSSEPLADGFRAAAPPPLRPGRPAPREAAVPVSESRKNVGSVASVTASKDVRPYGETKLRAVSNDGAAFENVVSGGAMKKNRAFGRASVGRLRKRLPIPTVAVMALGLLLTSAGFSDAASRWWIGTSGLLLVGFAGVKESILWRWRREQLREELAGQRRRAEQALAAERKRAEQALAAERKRAEQALAAERKRAEQALAAALAVGRKREELALITKRSRRSLVDAHLADNAMKQTVAYDICFAPHKEYHVVTAHPVAEVLRRRGIEVSFLDFTSLSILLGRKEGSKETLERLGERHWYDVTDFLTAGHGFDLLVVFNDWDPLVTRPFVMNARDAGAATVGFVEGINDFRDADTGRRRGAYRTVEWVLGAGENDRRYFRDVGSRFQVVGFPRIAPLLERPVQPPEQMRAVINVNFTYNVLENERSRWLDSAMEGCRLAGLEWIVSQHPQDGADLSSCPVDRRDFEELMRENAILISRFSSCIMEALAMGRPVVYYNPHDEKVEKFREPLGAYELASDPPGLARAIRSELERADDLAARRMKFLAEHCDVSRHWKPHEKAAAALERILEEHRGKQRR